MWQTSCGDRVLEGAEAALVKAAVTDVAEQIREESSDFGTQWKYGIELFDSLTWTQRLVLLEQVATHLLTTTPQTLALTAVNEATIGSLFESVRSQIELETLGIYEDQTLWRELVLNAYRECFADELDDELDDGDFEYEPQSIHCRKRDLWANVIEALTDRILWDRDYEMTADFLDQPPEHAEFLRMHLGINDDYFAAAAPDVTAEEEIEITVRRLKRFESAV